MSSTSLALNFEGNPVNVLMTTEGKPMWRAKEVSIVLGYSQSRQLADNVRRKWSAELEEGADYVMADHNMLKSLKYPELTQLDFSPRGELLLTEEGLFGCIIIAKTGQGLRFRKWLRSEVLPSIAKTGTYSAQPAAIAKGQQDIFGETPVERRRRITAEAKAKNAATRERAQDLKAKTAMARIELDREFQLERMSLERMRLQAEIEIRKADAAARRAKGDVDDKVSIALTALDNIGATPNQAIRNAKIAAIESALGIRLDGVRAEFNGVNPVAKPLALDFINGTDTLPPVAEDDGYLSPTRIAKHCGGGMTAIDVGHVISTLDLRQPEWAKRILHPDGYYLYTYSPEAVVQIMAYIKEHHS